MTDLINRMTHQQNTAPIEHTTQIAIAPQIEIKDRTDQEWLGKMGLCLLDLIAADTPTHFAVSDIADLLAYCVLVNDDGLNAVHTHILNRFNEINPSLYDHDFDGFVKNAPIEQRREVSRQLNDVVFSPHIVGLVNNYLKDQAEKDSNEAMKKFLSFVQYVSAVDGTL